MGIFWAHTGRRYSVNTFGCFPSGEDHENPVLARSYAKLERALAHGSGTSGFGASPGASVGPTSLGGTAASPTGGVDLGKDKWHEWFRMQREWMKKVEEDPDNYFDDYL